MSGGSTTVDGPKNEGTSALVVTGVLRSVPALPWAGLWHAELPVPCPPLPTCPPAPVAEPPLYGSKLSTLKWPAAAVDTAAADSASRYGWWWWWWWWWCAWWPCGPTPGSRAAHSMIMSASGCCCWCWAAPTAQASRRSRLLLGLLLLLLLGVRSLSGVRSFGSIIGPVGGDSGDSTSSMSWNGYQSSGGGDHELGARGTRITHLDSARPALGVARIYGDDNRCGKSPNGAGARTRRE